MAGKHEGEVYYSKTMPKMEKDKWPYDYNEELYEKAKNITNLNPDELKELQKTFIGMGLLDSGDDDGMLGKKSMGAARRYGLNTQPGMWEWVKKLDKKLFD